MTNKIGCLSVRLKLADLLFVYLIHTRLPNKYEHNKKIRDSNVKFNSNKHYRFNANNKDKTIMSHFCILLFFNHVLACMSPRDSICVTMPQSVLCVWKNTRKYKQNLSRFQLKVGTPATRRILHFISKYWLH